MSIITDAWKNITFVCGCHADQLHEMQLVSSARTFYYRCPMNEPINHESDNDVICHNTILLKDYEKAIDHISDKLIAADDNDETLCLAHYKWKRKELSFEVLEHKNEKIVIKVINTGICKNKTNKKAKT